jgi:hypothetical protein
MTFFKVKYKNAEGTELEIEVSLPSSIVDKMLAAKKIGISPSQIISIKAK